MSRSPDAFKKPIAAGITAFVGIILLIGSGIAFIGCIVEQSTVPLTLAFAGLTFGAMLLALSSVIALLTKIANKLAVLAAQIELPKPASDEKLETIHKKHDDAALKSPPTEPGVYKI